MQYHLNEHSTVQGLIATLDECATGFLVVVDSNETLVGVVSDGDIRRAVLRQNLTLEQIINRSPIVGFADEHIDIVRQRLMRSNQRYIPVVDRENKLVSVISAAQRIKYRDDTKVLILAGGLGKRLGKLTQNTPKPMLKVGSKPMLQLIIEQLREAGLCDIVISVKYLKDQIIEYFGDGSRFFVDISYIEETASLGTAGSVGLVNMGSAKNLLTINGDILSDIDFGEVVDAHNSSEKCGSVILREIEQKLEFGVVTLDKSDNISAIDEKPTKKYLICTGINIFSASAIELIKPYSKIDMPDFLSVCLLENKTIGSIIVPNTWYDVGREDDFREVNELFIMSSDKV